MQLSLRHLTCPHPNCPSTFKSQHGRTYHICTIHLNTHGHTTNVECRNEQENEYHHIDDPVDSAQAPDTKSTGLPPNNEVNDLGHTLPQRIEHPHLNGMLANLWIFEPSLNHLNRPSALPCDLEGNPLPPGAPPPARETAQPGDWTPFDSEVQFQLADLIYHRAELSASNIDTLLEIWAQSVQDLDASVPFKNHDDLYATIDLSVLRDVPWQCLVTEVPKDVDRRTQSWNQTRYKVWYHDPEIVVSNMLSNSDFNGKFDLCPYVELDANGKHRWSNVMSGNIAWWWSISRLIFASRQVNKSGNYRMKFP